MVVRPIVMHRIDDDTVVVLTIGGIGIGETIPYDKFQTFVLRRSDGAYRCIAVQNTQVSEGSHHVYASPGPTR